MSQEIFVLIWSRVRILDVPVQINYQIWQNGRLQWGSLLVHMFSTHARIELQIELDIRHVLLRKRMSTLNTLFLSIL